MVVQGAHAEAGGNTAPVRGTRCVILPEPVVSDDGPPRCFVKLCQRSIAASAIAAREDLRAHGPFGHAATSTFVVPPTVKQHVFVRNVLRVCVGLQNAMTSSRERTSADAEGYRIERSLMDCVAPP